MTDVTKLPEADEVFGYLSSLSNWGRWGTDDRVGTLNLVTPAVRVAAARLVTDGHVVSLAHDMDPEAPEPWARPDTILQRYLQFDCVEHVFGPGLRWDAVEEFIGLTPHGLSTHLDGLAHYSWEGKNYNGFDARETRSLSGARALSVHQAAEGFVTRGVLLDIPAVHGLEWLEPGHAIGPDELAAAEERQSVQTRAGDALMIYTGNAKQMAAESDRPQQLRPGVKRAGVSAASLPWLRERDIAMLGSDAIQDVVPSGYSDRDLLMPVHLVTLVAMGLWLTDNMALEPLARACEERQRWEFLFSMAPWKVVGVTSSPVNPVAVF